MLCANGVKTYPFDNLRPTPELSFSVRHLGCARCIVITASYNPKEYNGYKVYGEDGGQIPSSVAEKVIKYIDATDIFDGVKVSDNPDYISIGKDVDEAYIAAVKAESMNISKKNGKKTKVRHLCTEKTKGQLMLSFFPESCLAQQISFTFPSGILPSSA